MTSTSTAFLKIAWGEPHDGGSEIKGFEVQMKTLGERGAHGPNRDRGYDWTTAIMPERVRWHTICDSYTINQETRQPKGLEHYHTMYDLLTEKYVFRMRCRNDIGWSLYSEASEPMRLDARFAGHLEIEHKF